MTTVILAPNWLGDVIMALPAMTAVRDGLGGSCVVVARQGAREVARVITSDVLQSERSVPGTVRLIRRIRTRHPEVIVSFLRSRRAGIIALGSGARTRVGWDSGPARFAYAPRAPSARKIIHQTQECLNLPIVLGLPAPLVWPDPSLLALDSVYPANVALAPGACFGPAKRWPQASYIYLARTLRKATGLPIFLVGSSAEAADLNEIARSAGSGVENMAGRTTIPQLASLLRRAHLLVGNDSGVAHLAAWMGASVVVLFGSTSPGWTRPLGPRVHVVYRNEPCSPCFARACPLGHTNCLTQISPGEVLEHCVNALSRTIHGPRETVEDTPHD